MVDLDSVAFAIAKVVAIDVGQEFGETVKLGDELPHVSFVLARGRLPCFWNGLEETICVIKASTLEKDMSTLDKASNPVRRLRAHWFGQISECVGVVKIQILAGVICQDPWEHWVLGQIVEGPASHGVYHHEIVEVGDFALLPFLEDRVPR
ncbi:hypothetical protein HG531_002681 [Fusarium graminearum]|nr:hypothetical protein HG531_002681 [Fusarium graminearum]